VYMPGRARGLDKVLRPVLYVLYRAPDKMAS
jgi:hypothetical protein